MQTAGYTSGHLGMPEYVENAIVAFDSTYERAFEALKDDLVLYAQRFLSGADTKKFEDKCRQYDMGASDANLRVLALVLVGAPCPAQEELIEAFCHSAATRIAEGY